MFGKSLEEFWHRERAATLPPPVDIWQGTPEEVAVRLIQRDRAGQTPVTVPAGLALPERGYLRYEALISACRAPDRLEAVLRWAPEGAWLVVTNSDSIDPETGGFALVERLDLEEARRVAQLCLLLAQARFEAGAEEPAVVPERRFIMLSSRYATVTVRSDDGEIAEQVGHKLPRAELDQPWREGWTSPFAAFLCQRVMERLFERVSERRRALEPPPARTRDQLRVRLREQLARQVGMIFDCAASAPQVPLPMQLQVAARTVLVCDLAELAPRVEALGATLPPLFPWEKHLAALQEEIAASGRELLRFDYPDLQDAIEDSGLRDSEEATYRQKFPSFVAESVIRLRGKQRELRAHSPFYALLPYQVERDWSELREAIQAVRRRQFARVDATEWVRWASESASPGSEWALVQLKQSNPAGAVAALEARLRAGGWMSLRETEWNLRELRQLAPERARQAASALPALLRPSAAVAVAAASEPADAPPAADSLEPLTAALRKVKVGQGTKLVLDPASPEVFGKFLRSLETGANEEEARFVRLATLAPHVEAQPPALQIRFGRQLEKLDRFDRIHLILLADLRGQRSYLLEHATSSPEDFAPNSPSKEEEQPPNLRLHEARHILTVWDEPDALTRAGLVLAMDLTRKFVGTRKAPRAWQWRLQQLFVAAVAELSAEDRQRVDALVSEFVRLIVRDQRPEAFEEDWRAILAEVSAR